MFTCSLDFSFYAFGLYFFSHMRLIGAFPLNPLNRRVLMPDRHMCGFANLMASQALRRVPVWLIFRFAGPGFQADVSSPDFTLDPCNSLDSVSPVKYHLDHFAGMQH
jgi:hypothetical protein